VHDGKGAILHVEDLVVTFHPSTGTLTALDHVSLTVNSSEIVGLVGESGCGKSTLAKAILVIVPSPGQIV